MKHTVYPLIVFLLVMLLFIACEHDSLTYQEREDLANFRIAQLDEGAFALSRYYRDALSADITEIFGEDYLPADWSELLEMNEQALRKLSMELILTEGKIFHISHRFFEHGTNPYGQAQFVGFISAEEDSYASMVDVIDSIPSIRLHLGILKENGLKLPSLLKRINAAESALAFGRVLNAHDGSPIPDCRVLFEGDLQKQDFFLTFTDEQGYFSIPAAEQVTDGSYKVSFRKEGYAFPEQNVKISNREFTRISSGLTFGVPVPQDNMLTVVLAWTGSEQPDLQVQRTEHLDTYYVGYYKNPVMDAVDYYFPVSKQSAMEFLPFRQGVRYQTVLIREGDSESGFKAVVTLRSAGSKSSLKNAGATIYLFDEHGMIDRIPITAEAFETEIQLIDKGTLYSSNKYAVFSD
jgi:hypothetical protein